VLFVRADNHDIISISTSSAVFHPLSAKEMAARLRGSKPNRARGRSFFALVGRLVKWLAIIVVIVVALIGFRGWKVQRDAKRF
jgi:hypothetical protein